MAQMTFTCGHVADTPVHAGRGQARARKLLAFFGRNCLECQIADYQLFVTTLSGDKAGNPLSLDAQIKKVADKRAKLEPTYKYIDLGR